MTGSVPATVVVDSFIFAPVADRATSQSTCDRVLHDLGGSAVDPMNPRRGIELGDRILIHVACAAVQLHATIRDSPFELGEPELRHRRPRVLQLAAQYPGYAIIIKGAAIGDLGVHFGKHELRVLEIENA